ncbi:MAG: ABC transporter substrate-binding protein [Actinomycetia bacterium]|nr:ABC transporter substrate-binding protein [Actinomycetes bacterium]
MVNLNNSKDKIKFNLFKIGLKESLKTLTTIITIFAVFSTLLFGCKPRTAVIEKPTEIIEEATEPATEEATTEGPTTETVEEETFKIEYPITVTDDIDKEVSLTEEPDKIISLAPGNTEILFTLGLGEKVVGVDNFSNYPEEAESIEKIGDAFNLNMEKIIELEPDLILTLKGNEEEINEFLNQGIAVYTLDANNMDNVLEDISEIGKLTNSFDRAKKLVSEMQEKIDEIKSLIADVSEEDKPKVFYMVGNEPIWSTGSGTFINDLIERANGINIVASDGLEGWLVYSLEKLIEHNPDVIIAPKSLAPTPETITNDERLSSIKAVLENRVVIVDDDPVQKIGPRIVEGFLQIAQALYPDIEF